ncbi:MAG: RNA chaperone Hfq [bacterium]|nr:RNA chaperone Hfq [bacterium]
MTIRNNRVKSPQDDFLEQAKGNNQELTFYLMNGLPIKARVLDYDNFTIKVEKEKKQLLIFKHAISTIAEQEH